MKSINWTGICSVFLVTAGLGAPAWAMDPTTYQLDCRGGGNMVLGAGWISETGLLELEIRYERATRGTDEAALLPGTCAWKDRPLRDGEPLVMSLTSISRKLELICTQMLCEFQSRDPKVVMLTSLARSSETWSVQVYSDNGRMQVTEVMY